MSTLLSAELAATCSALGAYDKKTGKYLVDTFTIDAVKDLIRYLRRDGEDHEIRRNLGQTKVLQTDLIHILLNHWEQAELFDVILRLLVNLTNPALLLYNEKIPTERTARHNYLQILSHLQSYKEESFTKVETWTVFAKKLAKVLEIEWNVRDEDTGLIIERILILVRNVLHVPVDPDYERRPENDASIHDQVLWALNQSGVLDLILYISSENEKQYYMHILEIISLLLREQNPSSLASAALQRSVDEKLRDEQELLSIRMNETKLRNNKVRQFSGSRHSRFGGTYVVQNMKSVSDNDLICLKPLNKITSLEFGTKKDKFKKPKNRRAPETPDVERRSAFAVRLFLKEFCIEFLNGSYNTVMHYVKDVLVRAKAQQNDETYYLWSMRFFMEFNRSFDFQVRLVSETMAVPIFHYVQQQMEKYLDMIKTDKDKIPLWVKRLHLSLRAYRELLYTLLAMEKSTDPTVKESTKVLKSNIFYILEYREFILHLLLSFDDVKMPKAYLIDLVETAHIFLKMLENYCKKHGLVVQKRIRRKGKKKKTRPVDRPAAPRQEQNKEAEWEEIGPQMSAVLRADQPPTTLLIPFDATSDVPIDEQKGDCMKTVQRSMREHKYEDAIALLRAAREVWPEEGIFGTNDVSRDDEFSMFQTIFMADLGVEVTEPEVEEEEPTDDEDDEDEEGENAAQITEIDFKFSDFASRFASPSVVRSCATVLKQFDKNLPKTNHCALKMLHRVAWDCKCPSMLFQASLFRTFQRILHSDSEQFQELKKFAIFIIRKFQDIATDNPKVYMETLFWKTVSDAQEIEHGYASYDNKQGSNHWTEEEELELKKLYFENQQNPATDKDVIDWIGDNLVNHARTRRAIIKKLKDLGLIFKAPTKKSNAARLREKIPAEFGEHEDEMLRELWEEFRDAPDPISAIMARMPVKRPKHRFVDRLLELDLIKDKKECRKKRMKSSAKSDRNRSQSSGDSGTESDRGNVDGSSSDESARPTPKVVVKAKNVKKARKVGPSKAKPVSSADIAKSLISAVDEGFSDTLKFVAESLEEVALDQEAEGYNPDDEGVPLVMLADPMNAMENKIFQNALRALGIVAPSSEQEAYWRIPASLHHETIRKRCEIIFKAIDKTLIVPEEDKPSQDNEPAACENLNMSTHEPDHAESSSDDDDVFNRVRKFGQPVEKNSGSNESNTVVNNMPSKKRKRVLSNSGSESESNEKSVKLKKGPEVDGEAPLDTDVASRNIASNSKELVEIDDDDILGFAKKTIQSSQSEDLFDKLLQDTTTSETDPNIEDEEEIMSFNATKTKKRFLIEDDDSE